MKTESMPETLASNAYVNGATIVSTASLSIVSIMDFLEGILPLASLLLTTITMGVLLYYHIRNTKKVNLEIKKLRREAEK